jgi:uncharacterized protein (DUF58 family)
MGLSELFRRAPSTASPRLSLQPRQQTLFDEDFQRRLEMLAIVSRRVFTGRMRAERRSKKKGSGVEFADHRVYVPGDDFRYVDWNVYRRFGRLLVRLYEEEEDLSIYFLLDTSSSMGFGAGKKFDQARRLSAALAYVGLANLDRVTLVGVSDAVVARMPTTRGKARIFKVFTFLRELKPSGTTDLESSLRTFVAQHKRRGLAILLSDLYDPAGFERGFEPYVLHLIDPAESSPNLRGDVRVYDCETGEERELTLTPKLLARMQAAWADYRAEIQRYCTTHQVPYLPVEVDVPFDELVLRVFRRGGFLR